MHGALLSTTFSLLRRILVPAVSSVLYQTRIRPSYFKEFRPHWSFLFWSCVHVGKCMIPLHIPDGCLLRAVCDDWKTRATLVYRAAGDFLHRHVEPRCIYVRSPLSAGKSYSTTLETSCFACSAGLLAFDAVALSSATAQDPSSCLQPCHHCDRRAGSKPCRSCG